MGKLTLVSTGAGGSRYLTNEAIKAIEEADLIVAYTKYAKDLPSLMSEKEVYTTPMTKEIERVDYAIEEAKKGRRVALLSNGDANVYAMGSLVVELIDVKIIGMILTTLLLLEFHQFWHLLVKLALHFLKIFVLFHSQID